MQSPSNYSSPYHNYSTNPNATNVNTPPPPPSSYASPTAPQYQSPNPLYPPSNVPSNTANYASPHPNPNTPTTVTSPVPSSSLSTSASTTNSDTILPTVRVMRLYKPCMHMTPTIPYLPGDESSNNLGTGSGFAISPYLLLPDSFGEIFVGETFSAYIAVLNGSDSVVYRDLYLNVRLQTSNASYDLVDIRPTDGKQSGYATTLGPGESLDVVVRQVLTEVGQHTLRVTVQYLTNNNRSNEPKTNKKFYRFSAVEPLVIASSCSELGNQVMVQCQVTNAIKLPVFIEKMDFLSAHQDAVVKYLTAPVCGSTATSKADDARASVVDSACDLFNTDSLPLLLPNESYAFAVAITRDGGRGDRSYDSSEIGDQSGAGVTSSMSLSSIPSAMSRCLGVPAVNWRLQMGEHGTAHGENVFLPTPGAALGLSDGHFVRVHCLNSPGKVFRGEDFAVTLRITNLTSKAASVKLVYRDTPQQGASTSVPTTSMSGRPQSVSSNQNTSALMSALSSNLPNEDTVSNALAQMSLGSGVGASSVDSKTGSSLAYHSSGLCVTGLSCFFVSILGVGESVDTTITVYPLVGGLQELRHINVIDTLTGREYPGGLLFKTFVYDERNAETLARFNSSQQDQVPTIGEPDTTSV